jgi:purine-binding chemotaxis protein CheW
MDVLEMAIGGTSYVAPLSRVIEVLSRVWLTPLPDVPPQVVGAFAYRGRFALEVDVRRRLGQAPSIPLVSDHFVLTQTRVCAIAIVVDRVLGVRTLSEESLQGLPLPSRSVKGIVALSDGLLLFDELEALLSPEEEQLAERALGALAP